MEGRLPVCLLLLGLLHQACGARILLIPTCVHSHFVQVAHIGKELKERGHEVHMMITPTMPNIGMYQLEGIQLHRHHVPEKDHFTASTTKEQKRAKFYDLSTMDMISFIRKYDTWLTAMCTNPLTDKKMLQELKSLNFDIALVNNWPALNCLAVIPYKLGLPFVLFNSLYHEPWISRNPALPSFVPFYSHIPGYSERMTFAQRVNNLWKQIDWTLWPGTPQSQDTFIAKYAPEMPPIDYATLLRKSMLFLVFNDLIADYPRPVMPNEVFVGGLTAEAAKPLPKDLEDFMNSNKNGVVLVTFGSFAPMMPTIGANDVFLEAFRKSNMNFVWRYAGEDFPENVPKNVKLMKWLPQNDVLGHNNTRAFITHCGGNGQYEAIYHAIPMVGFPIFSEQYHNAKRGEYHGIVKVLNIFNFTAEELTDALDKVLQNSSSYSVNIHRMSTLFHRRHENPRQRAASAIEHVVEFGADHLRSYAMDMPWYEYLMLDILVVFLMIIYVIIFILKVLLQYLFTLMFPIKFKQA